MKFRNLLKMLIIFSSAPLLAAELDFNVSDDALNLRFANGGDNGARIDYGLLYNEDADVYIGNIGLHMVDNAGSETSPVIFGLGGKLLFLDSEIEDGGAIALGAFVRYNFPGANRFAVAGSLHYAPSVTAFSDMERYLEYEIRGEYEILRNGSVYLGYRLVETRFEGMPESAELDDGLHFGMRFSF